MPYKLMLAGSIIVAAMATGKSAEAGTGSEALRQVLSDASGFELAELRGITGPGLEPRQRVAELMDTNLESMPRPDYFRTVIASGPSKNVEVIVCQVAMPDAKDGASIAVAVDRLGKVLVAAVLDEAGAKVASWDLFLSQIQNRGIPKLADAKPVRDLERLSRDGAKSEDTKDQLVAALIRQRELMVRQGSVFTQLAGAVQAGTIPEGVDLSVIRKSFEEMQGLEQPLGSYLGTNQDTYRQLVQDVLGGLGELEKSLASDSIQTLGNSLQTVGQSCNACHNQQHGGGFLGGRGLQQASRNKRKSMGIGDIFFALGYDLLPPPEAADEAKNVTAALRTAVLFIAAARAG